MEKGRISEEQIIGILKRHEAGQKTVLAAVAAAASVSPVLRALRVDPAGALRFE